MHCRLGNSARLRLKNKEVNKYLGRVDSFRKGTPRGPVEAILPQGKGELSADTLHTSEAWLQAQESLLVPRSP